MNYLAKSKINQFLIFGQDSLLHLSLNLHRFAFKFAYYLTKPTNFGFLILINLRVKIFKPNFIRKELFFSGLNNSCLKFYHSKFSSHSSLTRL